LYKVKEKLRFICDLIIQKAARAARQHAQVPVVAQTVVMHGIK